MKHSSSMHPATEKAGTRRRLAAGATLIGALIGALMLSLA
jgi:hypothetical protein